jgi:hypothetical protein
MNRGMCLDPLAHGIHHLAFMLASGPDLGVSFLPHNEGAIGLTLETRETQIFVENILLPESSLIVDQLLNSRISFRELRFPIERSRSPHTFRDFR